MVPDKKTPPAPAAPAPPPVLLLLAGPPPAKSSLLPPNLLYGNKFIDNVPQRGQQGLGLTGLILYSQKTRGKPVHIVSKTKDSKEWAYDLEINIKTNLQVKLPSSHQYLSSSNPNLREFMLLNCVFLTDYEFIFNKL